jgi:hypothetical protein
MGNPNRRIRWITEKDIKSVSNRIGADTALVLTLDRDNYVYLSKDDVRKMLEHLTLEIVYEPSGAGVPRVVKRWKLTFVESK